MLLVRARALWLRQFLSTVKRLICLSKYEEMQVE